MRKFLLFIVACVLPFALFAGENAPKTEENIFELPISKKTRTGFITNLMAGMS